MRKFSTNYFKTHWLAILAFGAPILVYLPRIIINAPLSSGDYLSQYYLWQSFLANSLRHFDWPWWNPFLFSGTPFFTNPQSAMLFPLNWLSIPFGNKSLLPFWVFQSENALMAGIGGWGIFSLITELGISPYGALLGTIVWTGSTFFTHYLIDTTTGFAVANLLPLTLWVVVKIVHSNAGRWKIWGAILIAGAWFAGSPSLFLPFCIGVVMFWICLAQSRHQLQRQVKTMAIMLFLGILLSAVHLIPALGTLSQTSRYERAFPSTNPDLSFGHLVTGLISTDQASIWWSMGIIGSIGVIFGIRKSLQERHLRWMLMFFLISLILYLLIRMCLPHLDSIPITYNLLRYPERWLLLPLLGLVVIFGAGLSSLIEENKKLRFFVLPLGLIGLGFTVVYESGSVILTTAFAITLVYSSFIWHSSRFRLAAMILLAVCLAWPAWHYELGNRNPLSSNSLTTLANWPLVDHTRSLGGYDSIIIRPYYFFIKSQTQTTSKRQEKSALLDTPNAPLAWFPKKISYVASEQYLQKVTGASSALSLESFSDAAGIVWPTTEGQVENLPHTSSSFYFQVSTDHPGTFVFNQNTLPGWQATVDNQKILITPINWYMMSIPVAAGTHVITFSYRPPGFIAGLVISMTTLLGLLFMLLNKRYNVNDRNASY